ncbi:hypothetical protein K3495_g8396 [Podosphaera aphanis]|nr:hypothetical protein K3495_g8396 [Podosphaera aphanis]
MPLAQWVESPPCSAVSSAQTPGIVLSGELAGQGRDSTDTSTDSEESFTDDYAHVTRENSSKILERQTEIKTKACRSDNARQLRKILKEWETKYGITSQATSPYTSSQNGPAERAIQTTENGIRAMLEDAKLPILKELKPHNESLPSNRGPEKFHQLIIFGYKCFVHVDPKSHPLGSRSDKLLPRGRECVLVGYNEETTSQYLVYAPDLHDSRFTSYARFKENVRGGSLEQKLPKKISEWEFSEETANVLEDRKPRGRPRKNQTQSMSCRVSSPWSIQKSDSVDRTSIQAETPTTLSNNPEDSEAETFHIQKQKLLDINVSDSNENVTQKPEKSSREKGKAQTDDEAKTDPKIQLQLVKIPEDQNQDKAQPKVASNSGNLSHQKTKLKRTSNNEQQTCQVKRSEAVLNPVLSDPLPKKKQCVQKKNHDLMLVPHSNFCKLIDNFG